MGIIQSTINQALGMAAIAAKLSPTLEAKAKTRAELSDLRRQEKGLKLQEKVLGTMVDLADYTKEEPTEAASLQMKETEEKLSGVKQKQFELKPTKEGAKELVLQRSAAGKGTFMTIPADPEEILQEQEEIARQQEAMQKVATKQEAQLKQKRNFKEYLKQQPIAGGGTVGQLSNKAINSIAKQYSPAQRKKLMDTMDKEKMNKDGK